MTDPLKKQIGGTHYTQLAIQPMRYSMLNRLDACQHTAIKYITRFREKGGIEDLHKAIHVIEMLIGFEKERLAQLSSVVPPEKEKGGPDSWPTIG